MEAPLTYRHQFFACLLFSSCWFVKNVHALQVGDFDINLSLSQTYMQTSQNSYMIEKSQDGSFEWTEGVINTIRTFERLTVGAQLVSRDFGEEGDFRVDLDWGYFDYAFRNEFGVRLGRMRLPFGLDNEYRDIDSARMELIMPQIFNSENFRAAAASYQGIGLYGTLSYPKYGSLQYHAFFGNNSLHDDFFMARDAQRSFNSPSTEMETRGMGGVQLNWYTPIEGMMFGYTYLDYKGKMNINFTHPIAGPVNDDEGLQIGITWHVLSFEYSFEPWSFSAEFQNRANDSNYGPVLSQVLGTNKFDHTNHAVYYGTLRRQITDCLGLYLSYGEYIYDIATDNPGLDEQLKEASFGARYDLNEYLILKSQLTQFRGYRGVTSGTGEDWLMFTARMSLVF